MIKKSKGSKSIQYSLVFFLIAVGLLLAALFLKNPFQGATYKVTYEKKASPLAVIAPSPSPKSTPLPTPKPIVYSGFCQNVPILMYHHIEPLDVAAKKGQNSLAVDPKIFDQQMGYLASSGYRSVSVDEVVNALIAHQHLGKVVAVTLDDGYADAYTNAYPVFSKYNIKGNLMIPTGLLGNPDYMSWDELKRMVDSGIVFAYDHSWSHANIVALSGEKAKYEILTAKNQLEERLGIKANIFAFPYGSEDSRSVNILRANGFIGALSTIPGLPNAILL